MLTQQQAHQLASEWIQAWNSHNLDAILSHYAEDIVLVSPIAAINPAMIELAFYDAA